MQHFKKGDCDFLVTLQEVATLKESGIATCVLHAIDSSVEGQELPSPCDAIKTALARSRAPPSHEAEPSCAQYRNVSRRARHRRLWWAECLSMAPKPAIPRRCSRWEARSAEACTGRYAQSLTIGRSEPTSATLGMTRAECTCPLLGITRHGGNSIMTKCLPDMHG